MFATHLNVNESAMSTSAVKADIASKNAENIQLFTRGAREEAARFSEAVRQSYPRSRIFVTYRKKFIAVKVEKPQRNDMVSQKAAAVDTYADLQGYERVTTRHAIIFRISK